MYKILKYSFYDLSRSYWNIIYFLFFLVTTIGLVQLSGDHSRSLVSMMNIVIILVPLIATLLGVMYYYNSRDFIELLLAQPLKRSSVFLGQYFGLVLSLGLSFSFRCGTWLNHFRDWYQQWICNADIVRYIPDHVIFSGLAFLISIES